MGPAFLTSDTTFPSDGPSKDITDGLEWAQYNWQVTLLMALNGPSICHNGYYQISGWYQWPQMGAVLTVLLVEDFDDDLQW